jgi:PKD repeat protein
LSFSYTWKVDGAMVSNSMEPSLDFTVPGNYNVQLINTNAWGCADSTSRTFQVFEPSVASMSPSTFSGCLPLSVDFQSTSQNTQYVQWYFSDGLVTAEVNPSHTFTTQGVFDVMMIAISPDGCRDTLNNLNIIETYDLPTADFRFSPENTSIYDPQVDFTNTSIDAFEYAWNFGDGTVANIENPSHEFNYPGNWKVSLEVTNLFGCKNKISKVVTVDNDFFVFVPNAFSPDNDGLNDVFKPELEGFEFIETYDFAVYNKWGVQIFHTTDPKMAWLGNSMNGETYVHGDGFVYRIVIKFIDNPKEKVLEGTIVMVR